ncbi:hypothetical protein CEXT_595351 [Caerostris extrusa]|uniref:Uncharacterized protein n=1 Tax=Caerostris extrusa TaxID=172846 RepID=A0AAV4RR41_CAEEX|nr:hypothetical protein CEXT_595351 [Caerostris extrusa]
MRGTQLKYQIRERESQISGQKHCCLVFSTPLPISFMHVQTAVVHTQQHQQQQQQKKKLPSWIFSFLDRSKCGNPKGTSPFLVDRKFIAGSVHIPPQNSVKQTNSKLLLFCGPFLLFFSSYFSTKIKIKKLKTIKKEPNLPSWRENYDTFISEAYIYKEGKNREQL